MITYALILILVTISFHFNLRAQTDTSKILTDTTDLRNSFREEILLESLELEDEDSELLEYLENLKRNPLDINKASAEDLEKIPFINSVIANRILSFRNDHGKLQSKRALLNINGISEELYERIKVYLVVRKNSRDILIDETGIKSNTREFSSGRFSLNFRTRFLQELQPGKGYLNGKYEGSRSKIYNRLFSKLINRNYALSINLTAEKDAGEKNYADFLSGNFELSKAGSVKKFVAGDYVLHFGQGITMWNGHSFSKGISTVNTVKRKDKGLKAYSSSDESQFFRGAAVNAVLNKIDFTFFYSSNYFDSSIDTASGIAQSIYYDGYHRSSAEILHKNSLQEKLFGGRVAYANNVAKFGLTYWTSRFSKPIAGDSTKKLHNFSGSHASFAGFDYDFISGVFNCFGEWSRSQSGSLACINSVQIALYKFADLIFSYRSYAKDFAPVHSSGFGEKSGNTYNEKGFYTGISARPFKGLNVSSYLDLYEFPYRTYFEPLPVSGIDFLGNIEWRASKGLVINLKYKNENKEEAGSAKDESNREARMIHNRDQMNLRADLIYQLTNRFRLRSRYEYTGVNYSFFGTASKGSLFYSEVKCIPFPGLTIETRFTFFSTDDYDSRIYEYENDIKGVMSNVALYGKGRRWYLLIRFKPVVKIEISAKYAETFYDRTKFIGSGNDEIQGDINNRFSLGIDAGL